MTQLVTLDHGGAPVSGANPLQVSGAVTLPANATAALGNTTDAAVVTDAAGSIPAFLRGLVKLVAAKISIATIDTLTTITNPVPGKVGSFSIPVTLTVTNGAYTAGDVVGGLITLAAAVRANGGMSRIDTITLGGVAALAYELWFFNADVADAAIPDADPFLVAAADEALCLGVVPIAATDYKAPGAGAFNFATVYPNSLIVKAAAATTSIYAYMKAVATTTPGTTTLYLNVKGIYLD